MSPIEYSPEVARVIRIGLEFSKLISSRKKRMEERSSDLEMDDVDDIWEDFFSKVIFDILKRTNENVFEEKAKIIEDFDEIEIYPNIALVCADKTFFGVGYNKKYDELIAVADMLINQSADRVVYVRENSSISILDEAQVIREMMSEILKWLSLPNEGWYTDQYINFPLNH